MIDNCRSALLFKMQIFSILFCVILLGTNSHLDITDIPFLLESPNFPNPYMGKIPNLCGDVMDHPRIKKVLRTNFSAIINMQSFKSSDDLYHSGISAIVQPYNLKNPSFFTCNSTIDLAHRSPFFLVSQNYPYTPTDFSLCTIYFTAPETIRFAFYDFISNAAVDSFVISGETLMNGVQNISYSGKHVTDDEPFALYFKKSASVSFIFSSHNTFYTRGFYIIVNSYSQSKQTSESCINNGIYDLSKTKNLHIGSVMFGTSAYAPNMNCFYKFYNTQKNHLIAFELEFESEKCCDIMEVNGVAASPFDDQNYQGFMGSHFNFAMNDMVTMKFLSDGILGGPGFRGVVYDFNSLHHWLSEINYYFWSHSDKFYIQQQILEKKTLHLNDYNFMMDISVRLFQTNETYEFVVNARKGRYISIFFFTRIDTIVDIDIYNGSTTASPKINIEPIISNIIEDGPSLLLRSYGESIVIRIRAISDQSKERTDFQAMVTDWSDPKCIKICSNTESVYPKFIYGNYITISYPDITGTSVTFEWNRALNITIYNSQQLSSLKKTSQE
uniref:CUB_2 domain-containing protein n=1 Tax=Heterorhabditis bacteriophora TaxID=37862 RepID=A0A1I7X8Q0_HETBA